MTALPPSEKLRELERDLREHVIIAALPALREAIAAAERVNDDAMRYRVTEARESLDAALRALSDALGGGDE